MTDPGDSLSALSIENPHALPVDGPSPVICICCRSADLRKQSDGFQDRLTCSSCGLLTTIRSQDATADKEIERHYREEDPHQKIADSKQAFFREAMDRINAEAGSGRRRLLDVGCSYGYFLEVARRRGWQARGVEIVGDAVAQARRMLGEETVFHGCLQDAKYPPGSFDAITLWDVLCLVDDPAAEVERCFGLLADGGILCIRSRNARFQKILHRLVQAARTVNHGWMKKRPDVFHRFCFTPAAIQALLHRSGFVRVHIENSPLTRGDPYELLRRGRVLDFAKRLLFLMCRLLFCASAGRWALGPSLLVWARKTRAMETTLQT